MEKLSEFTIIYTLLIHPIFLISLFFGCREFISEFIQAFGGRLAGLKATEGNQSQKIQFIRKVMEMKMQDSTGCLSFY